VSEVSPAVVENVGDEVTLRCSVQFGAASNSSSSITSDQFPRLTMTFNDLQLTDDVSHQHTDGQPALRPHTITRVCLSVCLCGAAIISPLLARLASLSVAAGVFTEVHKVGKVVLHLKNQVLTTGVHLITDQSSVF